MNPEKSPQNESKREQLDRLRRQQALQGKERIRLVFMVGGLVFAIGLFLYIRLGVGEKVDSEQLPFQASDEFSLGSEIQFPQIDPEIFADVRDSTDTEKLILESESLSRLLNDSLALLPGHLDVLAQDELPISELDQQPEASRGLPFRIRGSLENFEVRKRTADGPEENWALLKTDEGRYLHFASLRSPKGLMVTEDLYIVAEGFFFKNHTITKDGERITGPLFVGREFRGSVRAEKPVTELDPVILADVVDGQFGDEDPVQDRGYWHLMNYAQQVRQDPAKTEAGFAQATGLSAKTLSDMLASPELFRGAPYSIYGQTVTSGTKACDENPMRLKFSSYSFLHKWELDDKYLHLVAPGREMLDNVDLRYELLGYFHKLWAYEDGKGNLRRVPVFHIAGLRERESQRSQLEGEIVVVFVAFFILVAGGFWFLVRRDRKRAELAAMAFRERRRQRRGE